MAMALANQFMRILDRDQCMEDAGAPLFEYRPCPLCGSEQSRQSYPINKDFPSRLSGFDLSRIDVGVASCAGCGHQFIQPVPTARFLAAYYASYMQEAKENFYRDRQLVEIPAAFRQTYGARLVRIRQAIGGTGKLLDIGCGLGMFLRLAKEYKFEVSGVEANSYAVERLHDDFGIAAANSLFENFVTDHRFDVITMWDLLEHLSDPLAALHKAYELLHPGGILVVETPARDSVVHWIAKLTYRASLGRITGPLHLTYGIHHLQYFSSRGLASIMRNAGFDVLSMVRDSTDVGALTERGSKGWRNYLKIVSIKTVFALGRACFRMNKLIIVARRP